MVSSVTLPLSLGPGAGRPTVAPGGLGGPGAVTITGLRLSDNSLDNGAGCPDQEEIPDVGVAGSGGVYPYTLGGVGACVSASPYVFLVQGIQDGQPVLRVYRKRPSG